MKRLNIKAARLTRAREAMATTPYDGLPSSAFWRSAVADLSALEIAGLWRPKYEITPQTRITTAGSCFAQHIGKSLLARGFSLIDLEPAPDGMPASEQSRFGYGIYSARYGNIYTTRQLLQLFQRASGEFVPAEVAWHEANGRVRDPFRPSIEPEGFASLDEFEVDREWHLSQVNRLLQATDVFVFTLGLTEAWVDREDGAVLPACPGTVGGRFDPARHRFQNFGISEVLSDAEAFLARARERNPDLKVLLTVSPVPLTATASGEHVLVATMASKSILRAAAAELSARHDFVDYFPSYEMIASPPMRAMAYQGNLRSIAPAGVERVMQEFFSALGYVDDVAGHQKESAKIDPDDLVCEEAILEGFAP